MPIYCRQRRRFFKILGVAQVCVTNFSGSLEGFKTQPTTNFTPEAQGSKWLELQCGRSTLQLLKAKDPFRQNELSTCEYNSTRSVTYKNEVGSVMEK
jgi:hypothetical protein